jgi:hypothetical protein
MSQAVVDFCEGLKATLLGIEDRLAKAKTSLESGAAQVSGEAKKHVAEAAEQLEAFRAHAGIMAEALRADLPAQTVVAKEKFKEFGQEAQVAMRHAVVFLAETASKGADTAAGTLKTGSEKARALAEKLRHDTALVVGEQTEPAKQSDPTSPA